MITIKNAEEIKLMREAGRIVALAHQEVAKHIKPGVTTNELNEVVERTILKNHATCSFKGYGGFPAAACVSVNEELVHGFPSKRRLQEGDIVTIDIGACYQGYHGDSAWSYAVGKVDAATKKLMEVTEQALYEGLKQAKPGNRIGDISHAIQVYAESFGYSLPRDYTGHGIGTSVHEDPYVPNYGEAGHGPRLQVGMAIAVEPMVQSGVKETKVLNNGWTVVSADGKRSAHYEHTIVITETGYEIMTTL